jgi:hypothetical protein
MLRTYSNPDPHGWPFSRLVKHAWGCGGPVLTGLILHVIMNLV